MAQQDLCRLSRHLKRKTTLRFYGFPHICCSPSSNMLQNQNAVFHYNRLLLGSYFLKMCLKQIISKFAKRKPALSFRFLFHKKTHFTLSLLLNQSKRRQARSQNKLVHTLNRPGKVATGFTNKQTNEFEQKKKING